MELNEYQKRAMSTCMPSCENFSYMMLNLVGEVGELASKVAKQIRKGNMLIGESALKVPPGANPHDVTTFDVEAFKEAGDILWQIAGLCSVMGWDLDAVAQGNLDKLASRKNRGMIDGEGDNR